MTKPLKVKVLKKSKNDLYPEHIIVERPSTYEMAHLYFDDGKLAKFTHIVRDPQIKMAWDKQEKRYKALPPSYVIQQEFTVEDKESIYSKGPKSQNFFTIFDDFFGGISSINFHNSTDTQNNDFSIVFDQEHHNFVVQNNDGIDVKEVYPHQKRKTHPSSKLITDGIVKTR